MIVRGLLAVCICLVSVTAWADDLWLASGNEFPGRLRVSEGGTVPRVVYSRQQTPNPAYPNAIMKVGQIAIGSDQVVYYTSGLDGSLMSLLDGRHEIQVCEFEGQIRDVACTSEEHCVYFSVVPTPQNGQPLADGQIYRRDFWEGQPQLVANISQAEVGSNWWGTFTIRDSEIYLATLDSPSRIFKWSGGNTVREFPSNAFVVRGLSVGSDGEFLFVSGDGQVRRTFDFVDVQNVLDTPLTLTDVTIRPLSSTVRP